MDLNFTSDLIVLSHVGFFGGFGFVLMKRSAMVTSHFSASSSFIYLFFAEIRQQGVYIKEQWHSGTRSAESKRV